MKISKTVLFVALTLSSFLFSGCNNSETNRYVVISTGGNDGQYPVFIDTKTREIYVVTIGESNIYKLVKKPLDEATKQ